LDVRFAPADRTQAEKRNPAAVAAAIKDLNAEWASEAAHIASVYACHFVDDMEIGAAQFSLCRAYH
jgi:hypothetical protein